jgi:hypothetical protein
MNTEEVKLKKIDGLRNHQRFLALLSAGFPIPSDLVAWYRAAVERHEEEELPLCVCLGIRGPGIPSAKRRALMRQRDVWLSALVGSCRHPFGASLWEKYAIVADMIQRYPYSKHENVLLPHLFKLRDLGIPIPKSTQGIRARVESLRQYPHYSVSKKRG